MKLTPAGLLAHARSEEGRKQLRYAGVSLVFVPLGQALVLTIGHKLGGGDPDNKSAYTWASLITAAILTLPNFYANKRFVWRLTSKENQRTQILVFWVAAMLGVTFATGLTFLAEQLTAGTTGVTKAIVVVGAQLTGFGIVWVARFILLDKWLFKMTHDGTEPTPEQEHELHTEFPI